MPTLRIPGGFGATLAALTVLLSSLASAQTCNSLLGCYVDAKRAERGALVVRYSWKSPPFAWTVATMSCIFNACQELPEVGERVLTRALWRYHSADFTQGQGLQTLVADPESFTTAVSGYATVPINAKLPTGKLSLDNGFTLEVTAFVSTNDAPATLLEISSGTQTIFGVEWLNNQMQIRRKATNGGPGEAGFSLDRPWDMDVDFIVHGVEPFRTSDQDRFPGMMEIYLTFTPDGKLRVDLLNVNSSSPDQQVTHLLDMGWPVADYPQQSSGGPPWMPATYQSFDKISVGGRLPGTPHVLQLVAFERPLTSNEILGYHSRNLYFGGTGRSSVANLAVGQQPCNSGNFLNFPPGQFIPTACGKREGQGQKGSPEPREDE